MALATLYRHFPGKEDLVLAYLGGVDRAMRAQVDDAVAEPVRLEISTCRRRTAQFGPSTDAVLDGLNPA